ncbi:MFS transporter [Nakamurella leprariae]|uniref:MFS transporter n=1 Tax=Nakamurella leprariae TaxID=2803911 RepID=A0A939C1A4_9ACTN|nr:MFS transporter [Nakamurella leprariae]MBM9469601.1 MFS transporter [Nakamurella leprariae]
MTLKESGSSGAAADVPMGDGPVTDRARQRSLLLVSLLAGLLLFAISDANVALPAIAASLAIGPTTLQLISAGYVVAFGLVIVPFGRLGDRGHRRALISGGLLLLIAANVLCACAVDAWMLILGRVSAGVSAGMLMPQAIGVIQQLFQGPERGRAFGTYGVTMAVALALAPTVAGLLVTLGGPIEGWRWVFLLYVPTGLVLLVAGRAWLPRTQPVGEQRPGLDAVGTVLLGAAIVLILFPLLYTTGRPGDDPRRWWTLLPAAVVVVGFWCWEQRYARTGRQPLLDRALLRTPSYAYGVLVGTLCVAWLPGIQLALIVYLQVGLDLSPLLAALVSVPSSLGSAVSARWAARRILTLGRVITVGGFTISGVAVVLTVLAAVTLPIGVAPWVIAAIQLVNGIGSGMTLSPNHVLMLSEVPADKGSFASSIGHLSQRIGNAVGVAATSAVFYAIIYRANGDLTGASPATYHRALIAASGVAVTLVGIGIVAAVLDWRRVAAPGGKEAESAINQADLGRPRHDLT